MINLFAAFEGEIQADIARNMAKVNTVVILDEAASFLLDRIRHRFLSEYDPDINPWIPSEAGKRRRAAGGTGTLFDTGQLFHSLQAGLLGDPEFRIITTDVPYAMHHQFGTGKFPKRAFLGFNREDVATLNVILQTRLNEMMNS